MAYSSKPGSGTVFYEAGSQADVDDLIAAQDRARAQSATPVATAKNWAPWLLGGLALAGVVYFVTRD